MDIRGKRIVLTGGASGIGLELLHMLTTFEGVQIVVADLNAQNIPRDTERAYPFTCDLTQAAQVDALFDYAQETLGGIDIFIANAGFAYYEQIERADWSRIEKIYALNVFSPIYSAQKMHERYQRDYLMVMTASAMSYLAVPGYTLYASTKAALDRFAEAWRLEPNKRGARLAVVYPVATRTKFFQAANHKPAPVPFPSQTARHVARQIVEGILRDRETIIPSATFALMLQFERFVPGLRWFTQKIYAMQFQRWLLD